jgi:hypothetical protein
MSAVGNSPSHRSSLEVTESNNLHKRCGMRDEVSGHAYEERAGRHEEPDRRKIDDQIDHQIDHVT